MRTLSPPDEITQATDRQEVCRVWIDGGMMSLSIASQLPDDFKDAPVIWGMLISDVFHHVVDAIVEETGAPRSVVSGSLEASFRSVVDSERGTRSGTVKTFSERAATLPDPDVSGEDDCVEIVRIFLLPGTIRVLVLVGMWLPDDEESVWGNILYDLTSLVALSLCSGQEPGLRERLIADIFAYVHEPSSTYSGEYYSHTKAEQGDGANRRG